MRVVRMSPFSGKSHEWEIPVTPEQLASWRAGQLIQNAMPNLSADQREFVKTGITPHEWAKSFGEDEPIPGDYPKEIQEEKPDAVA